MSFAATAAASYSAGMSREVFRKIPTALEFVDTGQLLAAGT